MELKKSMSQKLRMEGRDYSRPGWYFLALGAGHHRHFCAHDREHRSAGGLEVRGNGLRQLRAFFPRLFDRIELGTWQTMPNHFSCLAGGTGHIRWRGLLHLFLAWRAGVLRNLVGRQWPGCLGVADGDAQGHSQRMDECFPRAPRAVALRLHGRPGGGNKGRLPKGQPMGGTVLLLITGIIYKG